MRYRLRTLLIVLAIGPPVAAIAYWAYLANYESQFDRKVNRFKRELDASLERFNQKLLKEQKERGEQPETPSPASRPTTASPACHNTSTRATLPSSPLLPRLHLRLITTPYSPLALSTPSLLFPTPYRYTLTILLHVWPKLFVAKTASQVQPLCVRSSRYCDVEPLGKAATCLQLLFTYWTT
jgi:hypothetical protein